jgi:hypothetical protein
MVVRGPDDIVQTVRRQVQRLPVLPPRPSMGRGRSLRSPQPSHAPSMFTGGAGRRLDQAAREQYASRDPSTTLAVSHRRMSSMHRPPRARCTASMRPTQRLYLAGRIPRQLCRGHVAVWTAEEIRLACDTAHARHATRTMLCARCRTPDVTTVWLQALHTPVVAHVRDAASTHDAARNGVDLLLHAARPAGAELAISCGVLTRRLCVRVSPQAHMDDEALEAPSEKLPNPSTFRTRAPSARLLRERASVTRAPPPCQQAVIEANVPIVPMLTTHANVAEHAQRGPNLNLQSRAPSLCMSGALTHRIALQVRRGGGRGRRAGGGGQGRGGVVERRAAPRVRWTVVVLRHALCPIDASSGNVVTGTRRACRCCAARAAARRPRRSTHRTDRD